MTWNSSALSKSWIIKSELWDLKAKFSGIIKTNIFYLAVMKIFLGGLKVKKKQKISFIQVNSNWLHIEICLMIYLFWFESILIYLKFWFKTRNKRISFDKYKPPVKVDLMWEENIIKKFLNLCIRYNSALLSRRVFKSWKGFYVALKVFLAYKKEEEMYAILIF